MLSPLRIGRLFYFARKFLELRNKYHQIYDPDNKEESLKKFAVEMRKTFEEMGPTFIKFGQMLSLRTDFLPHEICDELRKLLDHDPKISYKEIKQIVEDELGKSPDKIFKKFERQPVSAASLAQVHKAVLKNNDLVAVKIKRPHVNEIIKKDIEILQFLTKLVSINPDINDMNIIGIIEDFKNWTEKELDFTNEGRNADRFRNNFKDVDYVKIPKVYWDYTSENVLVYEFIEGISVNEVIDALEKKDKTLLEKLKKNNINLKTLVPKATDVLFKQTLEDRFFHADPHPANIFLLPNNRIAFLDFGIVGQLTHYQRSQIFLLLLALVENDPQALTEIALKVGQVSERTNVQLLKQKIEELVAEWENRTLGERSLSQWLYKFSQAATESDLRLPAQFTLIVKQLATLDGIALVVDPDFDLSKEIKPYLQKLVKEEFSEKISRRKMLHAFSSLLTFLEELPEDLNEILRKIKEGKIVITQEKPKQQISITQSLPAFLYFIFLAISTIFILGNITYANIPLDVIGILLLIGLSAIGIFYLFIRKELYSLIFKR